MLSCFVLLRQDRRYERLKLLPSLRNAVKASAHFNLTAGWALYVEHRATGWMHPSLCNTLRSVGRKEYTTTATLYLLELSIGIHTYWYMSADNCTHKFFANERVWCGVVYCAVWRSATPASIVFVSGRISDSYVSQRTSSSNKSFWLMLLSSELLWSCVHVYPLVNIYALL